MSAKHVLGPWGSVEQCKDEFGEPAFFSIMAGRFEVADTASGDFPTDVEAANATLISAAPDLLEALRDVLAWRKESLAGNGHREGPVIANARAAIAKATGEKQ